MPPFLFCNTNFNKGGLAESVWVGLYLYNLSLALYDISSCIGGKTDCQVLSHHWFKFMIILKAKPQYLVLI